MWTGDVQFGGGEGKTECGLVRSSLGWRGDGWIWTGEVQFGGGDGTTECGLVRYSLGEERGRLNVDW